MNLYTIIEIILPVYSIAFIGYCAARFGWFSDKAAEGLALFVFDYAVPIMLIRIFANTILPEQIPWALFGSFYIAGYFCYVFGMFVSAKIFGHQFMTSVITGFTCAFGNLVLVGLPVITRTFGESATVPYFIILSIHGLSYFAITTVLFEYGKNRHETLAQVPKKILLGLVKNPFIIAMCIGILLNQTGTKLPVTLDAIAGYMQAAVVPCALFSLGASLTKYKIAGQVTEAVFIVFVKNILFPLLVWTLATNVFALNILWAAVLTIMAAQPAGVTVYLFAQRYTAGRALATTTIFLSSLFSIISITVLLFIFASMEIF